MSPKHTNTNCFTTHAVASLSTRQEMEHVIQLVAPDTVVAAELCV